MSKGWKDSVGIVRPIKGGGLGAVFPYRSLNWSCFVLTSCRTDNSTVSFPEVFFADLRCLGLNFPEGENCTALHLSATSVVLVNELRK